MLREREMHVERVSDCRGARTSRVQRETYSDDSARIRLDPRDRVTEGREERLPTRSIRFRLQTSSFVILNRRQASHSDVVATTVLENLLCCLLTVADKVHAAPSLIPHSRRENEVHGLLRSNHDSVCVCGRERERETRVLSQHSASGRGTVQQNQALELEASASDWSGPCSAPARERFCSTIKRKGSKLTARVNGRRVSLFHGVRSDTDDRSGNSLIPRYFLSRTLSHALCSGPCLPSSLLVVAVPPFLRSISIRSRSKLLILRDDPPNPRRAPEPVVRPDLRVVGCVTPGALGLEGSCKSCREGTRQIGRGSESRCASRTNDESCPHRPAP